MAKRVCLERGCPTLIDQGQARCTKHERARDRARGTSTQRGYGSQHQRERERWRPLVESGAVPCWRCTKVIAGGQAWDLGHPDAHCPRPTAPEHEACNRAVSGR